MRFVAKLIVIAVLFAGIALAPAVAHAQEQRIAISFTPAVATVGGDTELALAGSVGYRFSEHLTFEGDVTWIDAAAGGVRDREFQIDGRSVTTAVVSDALRRTSGMFGGSNRLPSFDLRNMSMLTVGLPVGPGTLRGAADGQTTIGTLGVRYEPMVQTARFRPFLSGGLGLNFTDQELTLDSTAVTGAFDESVSHSGIAFSAGGGARIQLFSSLWADVDAKYFRLSRDRNVMRLGGGVAFRF